MSNRDHIEPRACVTLTLEELDTLLVHLARSLPLKPDCERLYTKFVKMRFGIIDSAKKNVPAIEDDPRIMEAYRINYFD